MTRLAKTDTILGAWCADNSIRPIVYFVVLNSVTGAHRAEALYVKDFTPELTTIYRTAREVHNVLLAAVQEVVK